MKLNSSIQFGALFKVDLSNNNFERAKEKLASDPSFKYREEPGDWSYAGSDLAELAGYDQLELLESGVTATNFSETRAVIRVDEEQRRLNIQTDNPSIARPADYDVVVSGVLSKLLDKDLTSTLSKHFPWEHFSDIVTLRETNVDFYISDKLSLGLKENPNAVIDGVPALIVLMEGKRYVEFKELLHHPKLDLNTGNVGLNVLSGYIHPSTNQDALLMLINHPNLDLSVDNKEYNKRTPLGWARKHGLTELVDALVVRGAME